MIFIFLRLCLCRMTSKYDVIRPFCAVRSRYHVFNDPISCQQQHDDLTHTHVSNSAGTIQMSSRYFLPFLPILDEASQRQQQHPQRSLTKGKLRSLILNSHIQISHYIVFIIRRCFRPS